jgi:chromosomal replication initiation ATPase DnaA
MRILKADEIRAMRAHAISDGASCFWAIVGDVCEDRGVSLSDIKSRTRGTAQAASARAWICRIAFDRGMTLKTIGGFLRRDHTSVSSAIATTHRDAPNCVFKSRRGAV